MRRFIRFFVRPISTASFDHRLGQFACYAVSLMVLVLGFLKVSRLGLDEAHLFFGVLMVLILAMLAIIIGTLIAPRAKPE
jgi:hypothetical protein